MGFGGCLRARGIYSLLLRRFPCEPELLLLVQSALLPQACGFESFGRIGVRPHPPQLAVAKLILEPDWSVDGEVSWTNV